MKALKVFFSTYAVEFFIKDNQSIELKELETIVAELETQKALNNLAVVAIPCKVILT